MQRKQALLLLATLAALASPQGAGAAASQAPLAERHVARGLACTACHIAQGSAELKKAGDYGVCATCHGDYDAMIKKTDGRFGKDPNPHDQHDGALPCTECHKGHSAGKNYCGECHSFTYKVP